MVWVRFRVVIVPEPRKRSLYERCWLRAWYFYEHWSEYFYYRRHQMVEWWKRRRALRKLFREFLQADLIYVRHVHEPTPLYLGGTDPVTVANCRIEVLAFPLPADGKEG